MSAFCSDIAAPASVQYLGPRWTAFLTSSAPENLGRCPQRTALVSLRHDIPSLDRFQGSLEDACNLEGRN
jgi:hypothetical protein